MMALVWVTFSNPTMVRSALREISKHPCAKGGSCRGPGERDQRHV